MHGVPQDGGAIGAEAHVQEETVRLAGRLEGGLVKDQVETVDGLNLEGGLSGEGVGGGACFSRGAGYGRWAPRPPSRYGNRRPGDYQAVSAAERSSVRNPHCIRG